MSAGGRAYGPLDFASDSKVPRETLERLTTYARLLVERNTQLNLVADSTIADMWRRHFWDSAQVADLIPEGTKTIVDLGSGAGFPGMVLAIMLGGAPSTIRLRQGFGGRSPSPAKAGADEQGPGASHPPFALAGEVDAAGRRQTEGVPLKVHLIEATQKKCRFLEEVAEATSAPVQVHWARSEDVKNLVADVVTARAVAPLSKLLGFAHPFFKATTTGLFLKGRGLDAELTEANESWTLHATRVPSRSDPSGSILRVTGLSTWRKPPRPS